MRREDSAAAERGATRRHGTTFVLLVAAAAMLLTTWFVRRGDDADEAVTAPTATPAAAEAAAQRAGEAVAGFEQHGSGAAAVAQAEAEFVRFESAAEAPLEAPTDAAPQPEAPVGEYVVQAGDFLGRIAEDRGCTVAALMTANGLHHDRILVGQRLRLPAACGGIDVVAAGESALPERAPHYRELGVDRETLPRLMRERGFRPPKKFKALVIEVTFDPSRRHIVRERGFDWHGTSTDATDWNPASSIKLFAAIGALERIEQAGFTSAATVTFQGKRPYTISVADLVRLAIIDSDNIAYNRLVQLASFDFLHGTVLTEANGFQSAALMGAYQRKTWDELGENASLRHAPAISITERGRAHTFEAARGEVATHCGNGACASLQDLAEASRRVMLQEQLPPEEGFSLALDDLLTLRRAMRAERERGNEMVDAFAEVFDDPNVRYYSKPGFSKGWFSDNVYIYDPSENQAWIVTMAGFEGRDSLDAAARVVAEIIASGELRAVDAVTDAPRDAPGDSH